MLFTQVVYKKKSNLKIIAKCNNEKYPLSVPLHSIHPAYTPSDYRLFLHP